MVSGSGVGSIGVWLVSAVPTRASTVPMVVWAGVSGLVCVAVLGLCSLVAAVAASVDALAAGADVVAAFAPKASSSAATTVAAS